MSVFSWNVRELTTQNLTGDRLDGVVSAINQNDAQITFLLEVRNEPEAIGKTIVEQLRKKYSIDGTWDFVYSHVGKEGGRTEHVVAIIRSTPTASITVNDYGVMDRRDSYAPTQDIVRRSAKSDETTRSAGPASIGNRVPFYLDVSVGRSGLSPKDFSIAAWHAAGPSNGPYELWQMFKPALERAGIGVTVGDFNFESNLREVVRPRGGTTSGRRDFDGAVVTQPETYEIARIRSASDYDFRFTDHQPIRLIIERLRNRER